MTPLKLYMEDKRDMVYARRRSLFPSAASINRELSNMWKKVSDKTKAKYAAIHAANMVEYKEKLEAYNNCKFLSYFDAKIIKSLAKAATSNRTMTS